MKIHRIQIKNFRSFSDFALDLGGNSRFVIGECAVGKTSLLAATYRALGKDRSAFTRADFRKTDQAIEIDLLLKDFDEQQKATLCERIDFSDNSLSVSIRVTWDHAEESVVVEHGYPAKRWSKSTPEERNALLAQWLPAERDVGKYLQFGLRRNLIARLIETLSVDDAIQETSDGMKALVDELGRVEQMKQLLKDSRDELSNMLPGIESNILDVSSSPSTDLEVLRLLGLFVSHYSEHVEVARQSSGLSQLVLFAFLVRLARTNPGTVLLIDQPEISLHPQPQRSLTRLLESLPCQWIIATHSSNLLDRVDPRRIVCLRRGDDGVESAQPTALREEEARRFARYTTPQTAEAFFAKSVVLVEGLSDLYALVALAERLGRNLDAEGVTIVDMEGAGGVKTFLGLLGPNGFQLKIAGMCDADKEADWASVLQDAGITSGTTRADLNAAGFQVCDRDLEYELISAYGVAAVEDLIEEEGESDKFTSFCAQAPHMSKSRGEQLHSFFGRKGRKIRYAPLIVQRLDMADIPEPLQEVLNHV